MSLELASERLVAAIDHYRQNSRTSGKSVYVELGDLIGRSDELIRQWAKGKAFPPLQIIPVVCKVLNIEPGYLLLGEHGTPGSEQNGLSPDEAALIAHYRALGEREKKLLLIEAEYKSKLAAVDDRPERAPPGKDRFAG